MIKEPKLATIKLRSLDTFRIVNASIATFLGGGIPMFFIFEKRCTFIRLGNCLSIHKIVIEMLGVLTMWITDIIFAAH